MLNEGLASVQDKFYLIQCQQSLREEKREGEHVIPYDIIEEIIKNGHAPNQWKHKALGRRTVPQTLSSIPE